MVFTFGNSGSCYLKIFKMVATRPNTRDATAENFVELRDILFTTSESKLRILFTTFKDKAYPT